MTNLVEACLSNVESDITTHVGVHGCELRQYPCLEHCGICYTESFLVLDGEVETGENHRTILKDNTDA